MADHIRTQIRDAVVTAVTGLTTTSTRVHAARPGTRPLQPTDMPALLIYTNDTDVEEIAGTLGSRRLAHLTEVMIEGYARGTGDVDKTLDTIEKEVRVAIEANPTLGGKCKTITLAGAIKEDGDDTDQPTWRIRLNWRCEYHTREGVPDAALA
jgi:hypothetical protein